MQHPAFNPYLPSWEYIPDGEPHVYGDRVYVYGSHDRFRGHVYCLNDYVCWSAPVDDLGDWRYEGVIYRRTDDPTNPDGEGCLFAPDVTQGPDGRYYLYYVLNNQQVVGVTVCDEPAGHYTFLGHVKDQQGGRLGERPGDEPQFDPGVLTEGELTYLYTGFCAIGDTTRSGPMVTVLEKDMLTIREEPRFIAPSEPYSKGTPWEAHPFFEAPSIRKFGDLYYFVYSSTKMYELCYATSDAPTGPFTYRGVIVSNNDIGIEAGKPADRPMYYGGNNHGGMACINGDYYIFYHRHTNGTNFSRQACAERIEVHRDGTIDQVPMSSCGLNEGPLPAWGEYPAYIACHLYTADENPYTGGMGRNGFWMDASYPKITQDGADGEETPGYIFNLTDTSTAGFRSFAYHDVKGLALTLRGYAHGSMAIRQSPDGPVLGTVDVGSSNEWRRYEVPVDFPDGTHDLYLTYRGTGAPALLSVDFLKEDDLTR